MKLHQSKEWYQQSAAIEGDSEVGAGSLQRMVGRYPRRPGNGWKAYNLAPVWEHTSGIRVHAIGLCLLKDGTIINGSHWPESQNLQRAIREQGGTTRRGLMVWGLEIAANAAGELQPPPNNPK